MVTNADYDILIVGAGLAGLHCALRLKEKTPTYRIAIAELYGYVGGRVVSYTPPEFPSIHWENGAGRIHSSHTGVLSYVRKYGLHLQPLSPTEDWKPLGGPSEPNPWNSICRSLKSMLESLKPSILSRFTVSQLLHRIYGSDTILRFFPYRAEVMSMRADLALQSFPFEEDSGQFYSVKEGLSALIQAMRNDLESQGVSFLLRHRCTGIDSQSTSPLRAHFVVKNPSSDKTSRTLSATKIILAVHSTALKKIHPFSNFPILKHLTMEPLLRTYAIFPTHNLWFRSIPRTVTDSPLRYIIPIDVKKGCIMTSYTDADDTKNYIKLLNTSPARLEKQILSDLRALFPNVSIPNPLFFKAHPWTDGCTYWIPGSYDPAEESERILNPFPNRWDHLYVCGESYSLRQAWMEGAIDHAELLLKKYLL